MAISKTKASGSIFDKEDKDKDINIQANDGNVILYATIYNYNT